MSTVLSPPEARVILHNISWSLYEQLLAAHEDGGGVRPWRTGDHGARGGTESADKIALLSSRWNGILNTARGVDHILMYER